ncbi:MAG: All-trans-retinol 13,14-reductase [Flavipsychrobacter sp.]|jgi:all-trans-retinol 13,14-reductase|nr:All-trans-retinol 13,14-reductase [Flavipsychrobacter sp.]
MHNYDVVIIGSGLGGLVCGAILGMHGYNVCIFEKNRQIGGCLQTYSRDKTIIDTGVHYIGGLGEGQTLNQIFKYLGIMDKLKLKQLDEEGFDHIIFGDDNKEYKLAQGYERFIVQLVEHFPDEEQAIRNYCNKIKEVCSKFPLYNLRMGDYKEKEDVLGIDTAGFIASVTNNKRLQQVLAGNSLLYAGVANQTPLYIHALIMNSFIESAWKCIDGGSQIGKQLNKQITNNGGVIRRNTKVAEIVAEDEQATHIVLESGEKVTAKYFISNLHPVQTVAMTKSKLFRGAYRSRMKTIENTAGMFLLNIVLKENTFPYLNHNYYYHDKNDAWEGINYPKDKWPLTYALFAGASSKHSQYTDSLTIMTYMRYEDVKKWSDTFHTDTIGTLRCNDYEAFKKEKAEKLIDLVSKKFPALRNAIKSYYVATPLTYRDYQGTADGSMYGIAKDYKDTMKTFIASRTKIPNLFLTGQNLNLHGILGVTISALMTCGEIIDLNELVREINNA